MEGGREGGREGSTYAHQFSRIFTMCNSFQYTECGDKLDIAVLLDSSSSFFPEEFDTMKEFVQELSRYFSLASNKTSLAIGQFATNTTIAIDFNDPTSQNRTLFEAAVDKMEFSGGQTRIDEAFREVKRLFGEIEASSSSQHPKRVRMFNFHYNSLK